MKVCDNIICIKDKTMEGLSFMIYQKYKKYKIKLITDSHILVTSDVTLYNIPFCHTSFCIERDNSECELFDDYFITEQEYRKLKLDKINGRID